MALGIDEVALSSFFALIIIFPDGHLNLQDIMVKEGAAQAPRSGEGVDAAAPASAPGRDAGPRTAAQRTADASPTPGRDSRPGNDGTTPTAPTPDKPVTMPPIRIAKGMLVASQYFHKAEEGRFAVPQQGVRDGPARAPSASPGGDGMPA